MKILIFFEKSSLKPIGGAAGYLYNLSSNLNYNVFEFLEGEENQHKKKKLNLDELILPKSIKRLARDIAWRKRVINMLNGVEDRLINKEINQYDAIHFHRTFDLYKCRKCLEGYRGKIILTSHCPKAPYLEIREDLISKREYELHKKLYSKLQDIDIYAFNRADYIIFPCKEAEEPYYNTWKWYEENKLKLEPKKRYCVTGIVKKKIDRDRIEIRKELNIPDDAFVVSYVGRHNEVKGYPTFLGLWEKYKNNDKVYFLCCGKKGIYNEPKNPRWIEIGWTKNSQDYINASDVFILPNEQTYFDLVFLEVLSIGTPIIASYTGGNKFFKQYNGNGVFLYKNKENLIQKLDELLENRENLNDYRQNNITLFETNFNEKIFSEKYTKLMEELLKI